MKQTIFYRCMMSGDTFFALETPGYSDGGIGVSKGPNGWFATHIPTGAIITPNSSKHKTAKQALLEAEKLITESENILDIIRKLRNKEGYNSFVVDRIKQRIDAEDSFDDLPF